VQPLPEAQQRPAQQSFNQKGISAIEKHAMTMIVLSLYKRDENPKKIADFSS
jgi:hypothetical protein